MKIIQTLLLLLITITLSFGQSTYRLKREVSKSYFYIVELKLFNDSSCYIYELHKDFDDYSSYFLYKGKLKKLRDTIYEFKFQPVVIFGSNMGINEDSVTFRLANTDTNITSFEYQIKTQNGFWQTINFQADFATTFIKDIKKQYYLINTKFVDPLTKNNICIKVETNSDPFLHYFGSNTKFCYTEITISNNKLIVYPNGKDFSSKLNLTLIK